MTVETRIKDELHRMGGEIEPRPGAWVALEAAIRRNGKRRIGAGLVALALTAGTSVALPRLLSERASEDGTLARPETFKLVHRATIPLSECSEPASDCDRPFVYNIAIGFGSAWINRGRDLVRIDLATNRISRLDPATVGLDVADFPTAIEDVAVGAGAVWVWHTTSSRAEQVSRIDPATNRLVATIPLPRLRGVGGHGDRLVTVGAGSVWAIVGGSQSPPSGLDVVEVVRIDPRRNRSSGTFSANTRRLAVGERAAWYADENLGLIRVDPQTLTGESIPDTPIDAAGIAAGAGAVWLTTGDPHEKGNGSLIRIDPHSERVVSRIRLSAGGPIVVGQGAVWFIDFADGSELAWLDPASDRIVGRVSIPTRGPVDLAVGDGTVWVTSMNDGIAYRYDIETR